jgi:hypothetical protein
MQTIGSVEIDRLVHQLLFWNKADLFIDALRSVGFRVIGGRLSSARRPAPSRRPGVRHGIRARRRNALGTAAA